MALKSNLVVDQGTDYSTTIEITDDNDLPVDLTGYTANASFRKTFSSCTAVSFTASVNSALGVITLGLPANSTLNIEAGRFVYDVALVNGLGVHSRVVEGILTVTPSVTR